MHSCRHRCLVKHLDFKQFHLVAAADRWLVQVLWKFGKAPFDWIGSHSSRWIVRRGREFRLFVWRCRCQFLRVRVKRCSYASDPVRSSLWITIRLCVTSEALRLHCLDCLPWLLNHFVNRTSFHILSYHLEMWFRRFNPPKRRRRFHLHFLLDAHQRSKLIWGVDGIFLGGNLRKRPHLQH